LWVEIADAAALGAGLFVDVGDHYFGAVLEKAMRNRVADSLGAAGDDRNLAVQGHGASPFAASVASRAKRRD